MTRTKNATSDTESAIASFIHIPLDQIVEGPNARRFYDKDELANLAVSIKTDGLSQPVLVRPWKGEKFQLIAGFRRFRACKINKAKTIASYVRDLNDDEAQNAATAENMQRVDLSPLDEAELYDEQIKKGKSYEDCARIAGRHVSHIYRRRALLVLAEKPKRALREGILPVGHAELIATIANPAMQVEALKNAFTKNVNVEGAGWFDTPLAPISEVAFARVVEKRFRLDISQAPFDVNDETLSPLGKCTSCSLLTSNNPGLFGPSTGAICSNPDDYELKVLNWLERQAAAGVKVLPKSKIKEVWPHHEHHTSDGWINLDTEVYIGGKNRVRFNTLTKEQKGDVVLAYAFGRLRRIMPLDVFNATLRANGLAQLDHRGLEKRQRSKQEIDADRKVRLERATRKALQEEFVLKIRAAKNVSDAAFFDYVGRCLIVDRGWQLENVLPRHIEIAKKERTGDRVKTALAEFGAMTLPAKRAFVIDCVTDGWNTGNGGPVKNDLFSEGAALVGVDVAGIKKRIRDEFAAKAKERDARDAKKKAKTRKQKRTTTAASNDD